VLVGGSTCRAAEELAQSRSGHSQISVSIHMNRMANGATAGRPYKKSTRLTPSNSKRTVSEISASSHCEKKHIKEWTRCLRAAVTMKKVRL